MNILTENHLLPANASNLEKALSASTDLLTRLGPPADAIASFKSVPPDSVLPFLIWEYGLGELQPFIPDQRRLIREGIQWQRIRGTPAAIHKALAWIGLQVAIEEERGGPHWAEFQLGVNGVLDEETLRRLVTLVRLSKPARCRLWRIYNEELDERPGVWSGPLPWSEFVWTYYSGAPVPGVDDDLIVSFGAKRGLQSQAYLPTTEGGSIGGTTHHGFQIPYLDTFVWGRTAWGEKFPPAHGFAVGQICSLLWAERQTIPYGWTGPWDTRHWVEVTGWDRQLPRWTMRWRNISKVSHAWSEPDDEPAAPLSSGTWGDINASWSIPRAVVIDNPSVWGCAAYSGHDPGRREILLHELFMDRRTAQVPVISPVDPFGGAFSVLTTFFPASPAKRAEVDMHGVFATSAPPVRPRPPAVRMASAFGAQSAACPRTSPLCAVHATHAGSTSPLRNQRWTGAWDARRWWDYVGYTNTSTLEG